MRLHAPRARTPTPNLPHNPLLGAHPPLHTLTPTHNATTEPPDIPFRPRNDRSHTGSR